MRETTGREQALSEEAEVAGVLADLADQGYAITGQRRALVSYVLALPGCFTSSQLLSSLHSDRIHVGRATVFRTLELLERLGYLSRVAEGERSAYAVCKPGHHHHLVCSGCGQVLHLADCPMSDLLAQLEQRTGYRIERHQLEIAGLCPECQQSEVQS